MNGDVHLNSYFLLDLHFLMYYNECYPWFLFSMYTSPHPLPVLFSSFFCPPSQPDFLTLLLCVVIKRPLSLLPVMNCSAPVDVLFLFDGSYSIGKGSFERSKYLAIKLCDALDINPGKVSTLQPQFIPLTGCHVESGRCMLCRVVHVVYVCRRI